ncbi:hypothetical protein HYT54_01560 [Candidatus Woesearchaeota archaeon]|nr:hypothetical protein [Candidatus Woesearchaeota archaeon]
MNKIVINTSSSLFFTKIGLIPHLLKKFKLVASEEVYAEIKEGEQIGFKDAKILMQFFNDKKIEALRTKKTQNLIRDFNIKETDASVISLAQELECFLATEDRQIEKICLITQTKVTNTALLIYFLWKKKEFSDEQTLLLLDLLVRNGYNKDICLKIKEKIIRSDKDA